MSLEIISKLIFYLDIKLPSTRNQSKGIFRNSDISEILTSRVEEDERIIKWMNDRQAEVVNDIEGPLLIMSGLVWKDQCDPPYVYFIDENG